MTTRPRLRTLTSSVLCVLAGVSMTPSGALGQSVSIEYRYDRGPVAPPYHFQYALEISAGLARQEFVALLHRVLPAELLARLPSPILERFPRPTRHPPPTAFSRSASI